MNYPDTYRDFFAAIADGLDINDPDFPGLNIAQAWYGYGRQVLGKQRSEAEYPVLWVEPGEYAYTYVGEKAMTKSVSGAFMILLRSTPDDYDLQLQNEASALRLAERVLRAMLNSLYPNDPEKADSTLYGAEFMLGDVLPCEPVDATTPDNLNGQRVTFTLRNLPVNLCC